MWDRVRVGTVLSRKVGRAESGLAVVISGCQGPWTSPEPPVTKVTVLGHSVPSSWESRDPSWEKGGFHCFLEPGEEVS